MDWFSNFESPKLSKKQLSDILRDKIAREIAFKNKCQRYSPLVYLILFLLPYYRCHTPEKTALAVIIG
jgi:hypothetical protein